MGEMLGGIIILLLLSWLTFCFVSMLIASRVRQRKEEVSQTPQQAEVPQLAAVNMTVSVPIESET
jgi:type II secretory pathway component PulK